MDLCTFDDVKNILGVKDVRDDDIIQELIGNVSAEIESYLDRNTQAIARTEIFDVDLGQRRFRIRAFPITIITNVWNDTSREFAASSIISTADYYADLTNGVFTFDKIFVFAGPGVLKISYTGGMAANTDAFETAFPDIVSACATEVAFRYQHRGQLGIVSAALGGGSMTVGLKQQFLPSVEQVLDLHRNLG